MEKKHTHSYDLDYIREYMEYNNINSNLDTNKPIKSLGIYKIDKQENHWTISMVGPKNTIFNGGVFSLTIDFQKDFPKQKPEVRFVNKLYHLQVSPTNGHMDALFLNNWNSNTTITELLVGIYLFFIVDQYPRSPYSGTMAREYEANRPLFEQKSKEWVFKYCSPKLNEEDLKLVNMMNNYYSPCERVAVLENKHQTLENNYQILSNNYKNLENKYQGLEWNIRSMNNELMAMKSAFFEKDLKIGFYRDKYIKLLEELKEMKFPNDLKSKEKLISLIFRNNKKDFICSIICKETDLFFDVECSLYAKYPQFRGTENIFILNEKKIEKNKSVKENGIKDSDIILFD